MCRACDTSNGCEKEVLKSLRSRNDRNFIAEGKGVSGDRESEGSWRQTFVVTNRNLISGLFLWVIELWIRMPYSHTEEEGVNQAQQIERGITYPGMALAFKDVNALRQLGFQWMSMPERSAASIVL